MSAVRVVLRGEVPDDGREYIAAAAGDSPFAAGTILSPGQALFSATPTWVHPELPAEPEWLLGLPIPVVAETEDALVVDKPHGLPSTPNGGLLRATVQSLLRVRRNEPDLVAVHRLDRWTAGLLVLSKRPDTRRMLHQQFQRGEAHKVYRATAPDLPWLEEGQAQLQRLRMLKVKGDPQVKVVGTPQVKGSVMTRTMVTKESTHVGPGGEALATYRLEPATGHTHQLRVLMNHLGAPIVGDDTYPDYHPIPKDVRPEEPLQLVAEEIEMRLEAASTRRTRVQRGRGAQSALSHE